MFIDAPSQTSMILCYICVMLLIASHSQMICYL